MYVTSLVMLAAAVVTLLLGARQGGLALIFVSIGCSAMSSLFLAVSVGRGGTGEVQGRPEPWVRGWAAAGAAPPATEASVGALAAEPPPPIAVAPERPSLAAAAPPGEPGVVALPGRGIYHRPGCRHARTGHGPEALSLGAARRRGYRPCGVCRPG